MGHDYSRGLPQSILACFNSIFLFVSLLFILVGSIFFLAPNLVIYLINYIQTQQKNQFVGVLVSLSQPLVLQEFGQCLVILSVPLLLMSLCGYIGALRVNSKLLILYFIPVLVLWSLQLVLLTCLPFLQSRFQKLITWMAKLSLESYRGESAEENLNTLSWNYLMASFSCCGFSNYTDFKQSQSFIQTKLKNQIVPEPCCTLNSELYPSSISASDPNCIYTPTSYNSHFIQGCGSVVREAFLNHLDILIIVGIAVVTIEMILVILAVCLFLMKPAKKIQTIILSEAGETTCEKI